ncbi:phosphonate C-P lyase system protein PhnH [Bradyrhizobium iriomotense]|uniref:Carbon-phosphorus lyase subunit PhnH n=1 Tax=Bradyrhizobium iriomotense TaxID=441950 RepID=A0ABQ6B918_9BRAD|nr:phosphonate C-P lyase system protein PhnH [Bradyrhizobium iriomotense]GLR90273.1 carbon-phosphorus lyase subunit PhnH [Bradyrhizobium iriomotense]
MSLRSSHQFSTSPTLKPGLADPIFDAQSVFRAALSANAYPGRRVSIDRALDAPQPLATSTAMLCLSLMDLETPVWLDRQTAAGDVPQWLRFHCGAPLVERAVGARFAIITDTGALPHLNEFYAGEIQYPDRSATLIVQVPSLTEGPTSVWTGPGIRDSASVRISGLPSWFWSDWDVNADHYPLGIDVFFTSGNALVGLPRTIKVEA